MARRWLTVAVLAAAVGGCSALPSGPAVLVFHNRSDVPIAVYPTALVAPCSSMEFDQAAIDRGNDAWKKAILSDDDPDGWVPAGAVQFMTGIPGRRVGATEPLTVVVSAQPLRVVDHRLAPAELPPCGGGPVGVQ